MCKSVGIGSFPQPPRSVVVETTSFDPDAVPNVSSQDMERKGTTMGARRSCCHRQGCVSCQGESEVEYVAGQRVSDSGPRSAETSRLWHIVEDTKTILLRKSPKSMLLSTRKSKTGVVGSQKRNASYDGAGRSSSSSSHVSTKRLVRGTAATATATATATAATGKGRRCDMGRPGDCVTIILQTLYERGSTLELIREDEEPVFHGRERKRCTQRRSIRGGRKSGGRPSGSSNYNPKSGHVRRSDEDGKEEEEESCRTARLGSKALSRWSTQEPHSRWLSTKRSGMLALPQRSMSPVRRSG